jgi:hypothetical protein
MPISIIIKITEPDVVIGDAQNHVVNSIAMSLDALGPGWKHVVTYAEEGKVEIHLLKKSLMGSS